MGWLEVGSGDISLLRLFLMWWVLLLLGCIYFDGGDFGVASIFHIGVDLRCGTVSDFGYHPPNTDL